MVFYDPTPLFGLGKSLANGSSVADLRAGALVLLRLNTLARSGDIAQLLPQVFSHENDILIALTTKTGKFSYFVVKGEARTAALRYAGTRAGVPGDTFFRQLTHEQRPLGADACANVVKKVMLNAGIDTKTFQAHSVRGAAATNAVAKGMPLSLVRNRGGWSSDQCLAGFYDTAHQSGDWEGPLGQPAITSSAPVLPQRRQRAEGEADGEQAERGAEVGSAPRSFEVERSEDGDGVREEPTQPPAALRCALVIPLNGAGLCTACGRGMKSEPLFSCDRCEKVFHVACLCQQPLEAATPGRPRPPKTFYPWCHDCEFNEQWRKCPKAPGFTAGLPPVPAPRAAGGPQHCAARGATTAAPLVETAPTPTPAATPRRRGRSTAPPCDEPSPQRRRLRSDGVDPREIRAAKRHRHE